MDKEANTEAVPEAVPAEPKAGAAAAIPFAPNVVLAAGSEPIGEGLITEGMTTFGPIPNAEAQKAGFYLKDPHQLIRNYPRFKLIVEKGK